MNCVSAPRPSGTDVGIAVVADVVVGRRVAVLPRRDRPRIEEAPPALPRAVARFVIAAHDDPRRGGEQIARRLEEIGLPRVPAVAPRTAGAPGVTRGACAFAIVIVADVDDEIGRRRGGGVGDALERPRCGVVAAWKTL